MNPERFKSSTAGKAIQARQGGRPYWAFDPYPLPPRLGYDAALAMLLAEASAALGELAGLGRAMPNPNLLIQPFIRREAVLSSRIEGTQTGLAVLYAYEAGQLGLPGLSDSSPPEADVREVTNYVNALQYGLQRIADLPISLRLICELHERLMRGVRGERSRPGEFRREQNWIGGSTDTVESAPFVPPPDPHMSEALNALERYLHTPDGNPPLVRLALSHYQFEAIHPFHDGNGRVGRLLIILLLVHWACCPSPCST